jgi:ATP-binding cassette subfamily F protein uup
VVIASHDRYFLNRVCTSILSFEGGGVVRYVVGNYDYYLEKLEGEAGAAVTEKEAPRPIDAQISSSPRQKPRKLTWSERKELASIESEISSAENEVALVESEFADRELYTKHRRDWQMVETRLRALRANVAELYRRWEELEQIQAAGD